MELNEAKSVLKDAGYLCENKATDKLTKQEKYAYLYLMPKMLDVKLIANLNDSVFEDQEIDFVVRGYSASIKNGQFGGIHDDLADDPDTVYIAIWYSDNEDDYAERKYDFNELIKMVKNGRWYDFANEIVNWGFYKD